MSDEILSEPELKPASENPWYVLMTVAGEQTDGNSVSFDKELHVRNRRYWSGWIAEHLSKEEKSFLLDEEIISNEDIAPLNQSELDDVREALIDRLGSVPDGVFGEVSGMFRENRFTEKLICDGFVFPCSVYFDKALFEKYFRFHDAVFLSSADFRRANFRSYAEFWRTRFLGGKGSGYCALFREARFDGPVHFLRTTFSGRTAFDHALFTGKDLLEQSADFSEAKFLGGADFDETEFRNIANFKQAEFRGYADYFNAQFNRTVEFSLAIFGMEADFEGARFGRNADFHGSTFSGQSRFQNAIFSATTTFKGVVFEGTEAKPPEFYDAHLHEDTNWEDINTWPQPKSGQDTKEFIRAYERLKLLMDTQGKVSSALMFQRQELRSRESENPGSINSYALRMFRCFSEYGWSIKRPAVGVFVCTLFGWMAIFLSQALTYGRERVCQVVDGRVEPGHLELAISIKLAVSNIFGVLGFNQTFMHDKLACLTPFSETVSMVQGVLGLILFFLLGLALRNRFRIK